MTIDQVIKLGKTIQHPDYAWYSQFSIKAWVIIIIVSLIVVGFMATEFEFGAFFVTIGTIILVVIAGSIHSAYKEDMEYDKRVEEWRNNIAKPFIENLDKQTKEIVYIKIDSELTSKTTGSYWWGTGYTNSKIVERTPLTISYKDKGVKTRTDWFETNMELTNKEDPYIEYQELPKDLGHDIKKGIYNVKVYLPNNYKFTDIK